MNLEIVGKSIKTAATDLVAIPLKGLEKRGVFADVNKALGGTLTDLAEAEGFKASVAQTLSVPTLGQLPARRILLVGLGEDELTSEQWLNVGAAIRKQANNAKATSLSVALPGDKAVWAEDLSHLVQGLLLGGYKYQKYVSADEDNPRTTLEDIHFLVTGRVAAGVREDLKVAIERGQIIGEAVIAARDLSNSPPNMLNPVEFGLRAKAMAKKYGLKCNILDKDTMTEMGMNLFLAVGAGSANPPNLIHLTWKPKRKKKNTPVVALVGKGVTFDAGGLSLKPAASMLNMHLDMCGGAAVFGAMQAIAQLKPSFEVHGYIGAAENMTGSHAYRVNDIIKGYGGKTVEIHNTDAEGRLVLADTLTYACEQGATEIVDLATLTGACVVALGERTAAVMSDDEDLKERLLDAADATGESVWELPLLDNLKDSLKTPVADLKNIGGRWGGAITAGIFLSHFVEEGVEWAHIDLAGPAMSSAEKGYINKGGTGFGVMTLVEYVSERLD